MESEKRITENHKHLVTEIENLKTLGVLNKITNSGGNFISKELATSLLNELSSLIKETLLHLSISSFDVYNQRDVCRLLRADIDKLKETESAYKYVITKSKRLIEIQRKEVEDLRAVVEETMLQLKNIKDNASDKNIIADTSDIANG